MIRVLPAPEPPTFDRKVRQPGLDAIAELVGEKPAMPRPGPRRRKIAEQREAIPGAAFPPFWTAALKDLLGGYQRICAYTCLYIHPATGAASADHIIPKSAAWDRVYEWTNYRLACSLMNSRKGVASVVLDPFDVEDHWFGLEFVGYQVIAREGLPAQILRHVDETIYRLRLNDEECRRAREEYAECYLGPEGLSLSYLEKHAPFISRELRRQGRLHAGDS